MNAQHQSGSRPATAAIRVLRAGALAAAILFPVTPCSALTATPQTPYQGLFRAPTRAAADAQGNLYVTDSRAGRLLKLSTNGTLLAERTGLLKPLGVAVDNQGRVFVGEEGNGRVLAVDAATLGTALFSLGAGAGEFNLPNHIAVNTNANGWIFVSDSRTNQIRCYTNATLVKTFGTKGTGNGEFNFPAGLYFSPAQELYVVDQVNDRVQVFNSTGTFQRAFSLRTPADVITTNIYGRAQGISGDSSGNIFVCDVFQDEIKVFDSAGAYQATVAELGKWIGQLHSPGSAAMGPDARLFVASLNNNRIEIFTVQGGGVSLVTLQIISAFGTASPPAGTYSNAAGTILTNTVSLVDTRGTTQYVSVGWAMTGNDPLSGPSNAVTMTHTNSAVLTWLWKTQYDLTVSAASNGAVVASNGWWDAGTTASVTAVANAYYQFSQWTGTVASAVNPLQLLMNQPHNLTAFFAALLATNGVPQWWLASYGLTNVDWDASALGDQDTDLVPTWQEWAGDTVPTNANSFLGFRAINAGATGSIVRWHGGVLATQYIERASVLLGTQTTWVAVFTNAPPTAITNSFPDPSVAGSSQFYRVRAGR